MPNSVTVKISLSQDHFPHAKLLADSETLWRLKTCVQLVSGNDIRLKRLVKDLERASKGLEAVNPSK